MKKCSKCGIYKELSCFNHNKARPDGVSNYCKQCQAEYYKEHYRKNKDEYSKRHKKYWKSIYSMRAKEHRREYSKEYNKSNLDKRREYKNKRYLSDIRYRLLAILRTRTNAMITQKYKSISTMKLLGCSLDELQRYIELLFGENMSWENYGSYWEIDHIIPCRAFDLSKIDEQQKCFHYSNLQPLIKADNRSKSDYINAEIRARDL